MDKRVTCVVAEDEQLFRDALLELLRQEWPDLDVVDACDDGGAALEAIGEHKPDIAFLDIRMPVLSGLDVAKAIAGGPHIVFVTAYDEYAVAAFEEGAVDYVLKPPAPERIAKVVERLKARLGTPPADLAALLERLAARDTGGSLKWIRASLGTALKLIAIDDVLYFQSEDKYTKVVTAEGDALIRKTIKELYDELDHEQFWQVHRGTIVNLRAIAKVERDWRDQPLLTLRNRNEKLTVSRTFAHLFKAM